MSKHDKTKIDNPGAMWTVVSREALVAGHKEDGRTVYRREAKARLVAAAMVPGVSVAKVAREHGLNANQLHAWIRLARRVASQRGAKAQRARQVSAGLERAARSRAEHVGEHAAVANPQAQAQAQSRSQAQSLRLVPVEITEAACPLLGGAAAALVIEISGARIVVGGGSIDRPALTAVLDCLRESGAQ